MDYPNGMPDTDYAFYSAKIDNYNDLLVEYEEKYASYSEKIDKHNEKVEKANAFAENIGSTWYIVHRAIGR